MSDFEVFIFATMGVILFSVVWGYSIQGVIRYLSKR